MSDNSWMNNPALGGIDPAKLQMLASIAEQAQGKSQQDLLPFLMRMAGGGGSPDSPPDSQSSDQSLLKPAQENKSTDDISPGNIPGSTKISFDPNETEAIINVMKSGKSPQEIQKIDRILSIMKRIKK
ncbi:MAG: hypothetical protein LUF30_01460 [Lachnospiraceae bacterium]|nr:hypothetical protein [Lachnospiraceae bacterium]